MVVGKLPIGAIVTSFFNTKTAFLCQGWMFWS